jgi:hypothetical protein
MSEIFNLRNFSVIGYSNGFTFWHYKMSDMPVSTAMQPDYFADAADLLACGDLIVVTARQEGVQLLVTDTNNGVVVASFCIASAPVPA